MNKTAKTAANKLLLKYTPSAVPKYKEVAAIIEDMHFTVIPYKKHNNSEAAEKLIRQLNVQSEVQLRNSFVYVRSGLRFVFVNSDLSEREKSRLLCHELGHICDPSFLSMGASYSQVDKEEFANEFSLFFNNPDRMTKCLLFMKRKKTFCAAAALLLVLCIAGAVTYGVMNGSEQKSAPAAVHTGTASDSDEEYYVTPSGGRFHHAWCRIVKDRDDLTAYTAEEAVEKGYTPCKLCIGSGELR